MPILSITAGAAGMYCGSCFRDNALAAELLKQGQEVSLVPLYTPTRTDEPNVSTRRVLFGGISVYLQQLSPVFRKTPWFVDRVWDSPRLISAFANRASSTDARMLGELTISMLNGESGVLKKEFDKLVDWMRAEPLPDVINIPNTLLISLAAPLKRAVGRPVCCTLSGEELFLDGLPLEFRDRAVALIRRQVPEVDRFIAVSDYCARYMTELFAIPVNQMSIVPLGIDTAGYAKAAPSADIFTVGYFARIAPEKGLNLLAQAYVHFKHLIGDAPSRLRAAGYIPPGPSQYLAQVQQTLADAGLAQDFEYEGEVDRAGKIEFLRRLDVLSVPATYDEPKGLFLLEAMAAGVPVVQPKRGAFTEVVERTGGGILTGSNDPKSLAEGLYTLWKDPALRTSLGERAFAGVRQHYTLAQSADRFLEVARGLVAGAATRASVA
jgi:glycosyltransferase involved in cell wall biosynthesis